MKIDNLNLISRLLRNVLLTSAVLYLIIYVVLVFFRIHYPFELEWEEGAAVDHVNWILSGNKYYVSPSLDFVPSLYTPLFFYISALVSSITGIGFIPLRLVSFISSLGCFLIIYLFVKKETNNTYTGIIASCFFAATFHLSGSWFDIGRVDSLFLLFLLGGVYLIKFGTSWRSSVLAGMIISLSFLTKQTALIISLPLMLYCIYVNWRSAFFFIATVITIIGLSTVFFNYYYDGWYNYYVFDLPRKTPVTSTGFLNFWIGDITKPMSIAFGVSIFYVVSQFFNSNKKNFLFYLAAIAGMFGASWLSRSRGGGFPNVLLPAYAIVSILFGVGLNKVLEIARSTGEEKRGLLEIFIYVICIIQLGSGSLVYNPFKQIPSEQDLLAGKELVNKLAGIEGEIFISYHGFLPVLAGKKSYAHQMGLRDVIASRGLEDIKIEFINEVKKAMKEQKFSAIIINSFEPWYPPDMDRYYVKKERIFDEENVFYPITGMMTRPEFIYVPKK